MGNLCTNYWSQEFHGVSYPMYSTSAVAKKDIFRPIFSSRKEPAHIPTPLNLAQCSSNESVKQGLLDI